MQEQAKPLGRFAVFAALAGACIFLFLRTFTWHGVPFVAHGDQPLFFERATRILHGQVIYRDFFEIVTPGIDLLYAAAFRVFGVHAWVISAWTIVLGIALCCVITRIASRILRGTVILLPALLFLVFDYNSSLDPTHHWFSTLAALTAVCVLMEGTSGWHMAGAGAACGVSALFTQTQGVLVFLAVLLFMIWARYGARKCSVFAGSFFTVFVAGMAPFLSAAGPRTLFFDLVLFPVRYFSTTETNSLGTYLHQFPAMHTPGDIAQLVPFLLIYAAVPYVYLWGLYRLWRERDLPERTPLVLLHCVGLALALAVASGPRFNRLCTVAPPAILILVWLLSRRAMRTVLTVVAAIFAIWLPLRRQLQPRVVVDLPIGRTAFIERQQAEEWRWMAQQTRPGELLFNDAPLSLYLGLQNPASVEFINNDESTRPEQVAAAVQAMTEKAPHFIVLRPYADGQGPDLHDHSGPLRTFTQEHYRLAATFAVPPGPHIEEMWELKR